MTVQTPPCTPRGRGCCQFGAASPPGASIGTCLVALWSTRPGRGAGERAGSAVGKKITQNAHRLKHTPHTLRKRRQGRLSPGTRAWFFGELRRVTKTVFLFGRELEFVKLVKTKTVEDGRGSRALVALSAAQPQPDGGRELFWAQCHCTVAMEAYVAERRVSCRALQPDSTGVSCLSMCAVPCLGQTHGGAYGDMPVCD